MNAAKDYIQTLQNVWEGTIVPFFSGSEKREPQPYRDWAILLSVALAAVLVFVGVAAYTFLQVQNSASTGADSVQLRETIDRGELRSLISQYEERAAQLEELRQNRPVFPSPGF